MGLPGYEEVDGTVEPGAVEGPVDVGAGVELPALSIVGLIPGYHEMDPPLLVGSRAMLSSLGLSVKSSEAGSHVHLAGGFRPGISPVSGQPAHMLSSGSQRCSPAHCWLLNWPLCGQLGEPNLGSVQPAT